MWQDGREEGGFQRRSAQFSALLCVQVRVTADESLLKVLCECVCVCVCVCVCMCSECVRARVCKCE